MLPALTWCHMARADRRGAPHVRGRWCTGLVVRVHGPVDLAHTGSAGIYSLPLILRSTAQGAPALRSPEREGLMAVPWPDFASVARLRARGHGGCQGETKKEEELIAGPSVWILASVAGWGGRSGSEGELHSYGGGGNWRCWSEGECSERGGVGAACAGAVTELPFYGAERKEASGWASSVGRQWRPLSLWHARGSGSGEGSYGCIGAIRAGAEYAGSGRAPRD